METKYVKSLHPILLNALRLLHGAAFAHIRVVEYQIRLLAGFKDTLQRDRRTISWCSQIPQHRACELQIDIV